MPNAQPVYEPLELPPSFSGVANPPPAPPQPFQLPAGANLPGTGYPSQPAPQPAAPVAPQPTPPAAQPYAPQQPQPQAPQAPQAPQPIGIQQPGYPIGVPPELTGAVQPPAPVQPGVPAPQAPVPDQPIDLLDYLQQKGVDVSRFGTEPDPRQVLEKVVSDYQLAQQYQALQPYIDLGRQVAPQWDRVQAFLQQPGQPAAAPTAQPPQPSVQPPQAADIPVLSSFDRQVMQSLVDGTVEPKDVPLEIRSRIKVWDDWQRQRAEQLVVSPMKVLAPELEGWLKENGYVRQPDLEEKLSGQQRNDFVQAVEVAFEPHWYQHGPDGQRLVDPQTGTYRLTDYGIRWAQRQQHYERLGLNDPVAITRAVQADIGTPPSPAQPAAAAAAAPGPNGTPAQPAPVPGPAAVPVPYGQPPQTPQQAFVDVASQMHAQYPPYPPAQRGGVAGQPAMYLGPNDLAPPRLSDVAREIHGGYVPPW